MLFQFSAINGHVAYLNVFESFKNRIHKCIYLHKFMIKGPVLLLLLFATAAVGLAALILLLEKKNLFGRFSLLDRTNVCVRISVFNGASVILVIIVLYKVKPSIIRNEKSLKCYVILPIGTMARR